MRIQLLTAALFILLFNNTRAQTVARFTVSAVNNTIPAPVYVNLDNITSLPGAQLLLLKISGRKKDSIPFQVEEGYHRFLWWMLAKTGQDGSSQVFELVKTNNSPVHENNMLASREDKSIILASGNHHLLQYNFAVHYPPQGVDTAFKRSGFIHPLWSAAGNILTQINPADHYHHMGIWNPWTHIVYRGHEIDCWNLKDKKGTVRFSNFIENYSGTVYSGFKALQEHIAFNIPAPGEETILMNEVWDVRAFRVNSKMWICDFTSYLNGATDSLVTLKEYRYGGLGFRATAAWDNSNSRVLTSEGKNRKEADASSARWCMVEGDINQGRSGILFMSHPANYNFPEPMRVWPEDANKRGDVFFSFSPTRNKDWVLTTGKTHVLKYRMLVYDDDISIAQAEQAWKNFASQPDIKVERISKH